MPTYEITAPDGNKYRVTGEGSKEDALKHVQQNIANIDPQTLPERPQTFRDSARDFMLNTEDAVKSGGDAFLTVLSSIAAEPVAGMSGILTQNIFNPVPSPQERADNVESVRNTLTRQPKTQGGQEMLTGAADFVEPLTRLVDQTRQTSGDAVFNQTNSPFLASLATAAPDALLEASGLGIAKRTANTATRIKGQPLEASISKGVKEATPSKQNLKAESSRQFKEIDDLGITVRSDAYSDLYSTLQDEVQRRGIDPNVTPTAWAALKRLESEQGKPLTLTQVDTLREVAKGAATSTNAKEAMLGGVMVDFVDDFLEKLTPSQMMTGKHTAKVVGIKYRKARDLWGRFRRAELLDEAMEQADIQASGFENGIRTQFRAILRDKKKRKFFSDSELAAMKRVENGTAGANLFKALGKAGVDLEGRNNALLALGTGMATYGFTGDPMTAFAIVGASSVARKLSENLTKRNAQMANQIIRAGNDAREITEIYMRNTPKSQRSADELSLLLMNKNIDLEPLNRFRMEAEAAKLALERRTQLAAALVAGGDGKDRASQQSTPIPSLPQLQSQ